MLEAMTINRTTAIITPVATPGIPFDLATAFEVELEALPLAEGVTDAAAGVMGTIAEVVDWMDVVGEEEEVGVLELEGVGEEVVAVVNNDV